MQVLLQAGCHGVRDSVNKSAVSAASPDYVKFQAVIKSAASAASKKPPRAADQTSGFIMTYQLPEGKETHKQLQLVGQQKRLQPEKRILAEVKLGLLDPVLKS